MTIVDRPLRIVRTYHLRGGRLSSRHLDALERLAPRYRFVPGQPVDVLEIGSGMGDATAQMAAADPERQYLAVEVHTAGVANLLHLIDEQSLANVRVAQVDAFELLEAHIPANSLAAVHVFFPDPWPKVRHHKRRLIVPERVARLRARMRPGGVLHCATDDGGYAHAMLATLGADPGFGNLFDGFAPRPAHRPVTKFERRAVRAGRTAYDVMFEKR
jgi:tRNA (guanine-N7-)-methyltransferase